MIRVLIVLAVLVAVAMGLTWLAERPGDIVLTWQGYRLETSLLVGLSVLAGLVIGLVVLLLVLRLVFRAPGMMSLAARLRRREKGLAALSRGIVAAGAGDARAAQKAAGEATRHLGDDPLALLLRAQAAQLAGDRTTADRTFALMAEKPETRLLGLRGLHVEARRRGDADAAHHFAAEAHRLAPVQWAGAAVLDHHATRADWTAALAAVETNARHGLVDRAAADRQRAVLEIAIALDLGDRDPHEVERLAREAVSLAPDFVPANVLLGRTLARRGDIRRATRTLEAAWRIAPHPDLARAYLDVRPGDSSSDRLARAESLWQIDRNHPESRLAVARAALEARDFARAREIMGPLVEPGAQPTRRMCLLMADLEETQNGPSGLLREWLARASRAPRDPAWIADGVVAEEWAPISPVTGKLDAFVWKVPDERLSAPLDPMPEPSPVVALPLPPEPAVQPALAPVQAAISPPPASTLRKAAPAVPVVLAPDDPGPAEA